MGLNGPRSWFSDVCRQRTQARVLCRCDRCTHTGLKCFAGGSDCRPFSRLTRSLGRAASPAPSPPDGPARLRSGETPPGAQPWPPPPRDDHRGHIGAAQQRRHGQQHVRDPTAGTPRPARTQPHRPVCTSKLSRPGPPPARQHAAACRAAQLARRQPALDSIDIRLYVTTAPPERTDGPPARLRQRHTGGAVAYNDVITVPPRHCKHQTRYDRLTSCSSSTPDRYPPVLNLNAPEHSGPVGQHHVTRRDRTKG